MQADTNTAHCGIQECSQQRVSHILPTTVLQQYRGNDEINADATGTNGHNKNMTGNLGTT